MKTTLQQEIAQLLASHGTEEMVQFFAFSSQAAYTFRNLHEEEFLCEFGQLGERIMQKAQEQLENFL